MRVYFHWFRFHHCILNTSLSSYNLPIFLPTTLPDLTSTLASAYRTLRHEMHRHDFAMPRLYIYSVPTDSHHAPPQRSFNNKRNRTRAHLNLPNILIKVIQPPFHNNRGFVPFRLHLPTISQKNSHFTEIENSPGLPDLGKAIEPSVPECSLKINTSTP